MIWASLVCVGLASDSKSIAITHVSVIPMDRETVLADQTVITKGAVILSIGPSISTVVPKGSTVINGKGKFLIPGLIDMDTKILSAHELPLYLANGVTTVFNQDGRPSHISWRNKVNQGQLLGPNIITSGPKIAQSRTSAEAVNIVSTQARAGYDSIFLDFGVSASSFSSLLSSARKNKMLAFGSIPRAPGFPAVIESKLPIVHVEEFFQTYLAGAKDMMGAMKRAAKFVATAKIPVIPSIVSTVHKIRQAQDLKGFLIRTDTQLLSPWQRELWQPGFNDIQNRFGDRTIQPGLLLSLENEKEMVRQLRLAGATLLVGTNSNTTGVVPGNSVIEEVKNFQKLGFSNYQAIRAATFDSAIALNRKPTIGSLSNGKVADMVLLNANPLVELNNLDNRAGVFIAGQWLPSGTLNKNVLAIPANYNNLISRGLVAMKKGPSVYQAFQSENDPFSLMTSYLQVELIKSGGESEYAKYVDQKVKADPKSLAFTEAGVNNYGYWLINTKKQIGLAIRVFAVNVRRHPKSANVYDSLAEGYLLLGNRAKAKEWYQRALQINPKFPSAIAALKKLGALKQ